MLQIDLNCDMGESFGAYRIGQDEEMVKSIRRMPESEGVADD